MFLLLATFSPINPSTSKWLKYFCLKCIYVHMFMHRAEKREAQFSLNSNWAHDKCYCDDLILFSGETRFIQFYYWLIVSIKPILTHNHNHIIWLMTHWQILAIFSLSLSSHSNQITGFFFLRWSVSIEQAMKHLRLDFF